MISISINSFLFYAKSCHSHISQHKILINANPEMLRITFKYIYTPIYSFTLIICYVWHFFQLGAFRLQLIEIKPIDRFVRTSPGHLQDTSLGNFGYLGSTVILPQLSSSYFSSSRFHASRQDRWVVYYPAAFL